MDWDSVHTIEDLRKQMGDRDAHAGEMSRSEVLARNRRALVIYGDEHLVRKNTVMGAADPWPRGLLPGWRRLLLPTCSQCNTDTRSDWSKLQPDVVSWPNPSLPI